jgi:hypothetical protein
MILKPTTIKQNKAEILGFDIETFTKKNKFLCASLFELNYGKTFFSKSKREMINKIMSLCNTKRERKFIISASNLSFDFFGTFHDEKEEQDFNTLFRGSNLLTAKYRSKKQNKITFLDTMNYAPFSVEKWGNILNLPKIEKPKFLGNMPKNENEWEIMREYNARDAEISARALKFLYSSFEHLGATPKITLASTAMSLFKNQYLKDNYFRHDIPALLDLQQGYYGGRCEAFARGKFIDANYYDLNSLYPSVMVNEVPNPNFLRICRKNDINIIRQYDGISLVTVHVPKMDYPLLPFRSPDKLLFPYGIFRSWQSHLELRRAMQLGIKILKVHKSYYYTENCSPFKKYVNDLYEMRKVMKAENNPMEIVVKLLMNSLYGKFGQKFIDKDNYIPMKQVTVEMLESFKHYERIGNFMRVVKDNENPSSFTIPIWALYITSYARLKLYDYISIAEPLYCDTDSIMTFESLEDSRELGKMKLEMRIKEGIIVKPKFYALISDDNKEYVKIKGVSSKMVFKDFTELLVKRKVSYEKFTKFREALRRGMLINEIQDIMKELSLEDNKRLWNDTFSILRLQESEPINLNAQKLTFLAPQIYSKD